MPPSQRYAGGRLKQTSWATRVNAQFGAKSVNTRRSPCQSHYAGVITGILRDFDGEFIDVRAKRKFGPAWEIDKNLKRGFVYLDIYDGFEWDF